MTAEGGKSSPSRRPVGRRDVRRYVHSGGYNKLAGRSMAPGSERPAAYYVKRRIAYIIFGLLFLGTALRYVFF